MDDDLPIMVGGIPLVSPSVNNSYLMCLLWGDSGAGKTTLAMTAPGRKLHVLLDPGGDLSLAGRDDVSVLNLASESPLKLINQFATADPYGIGKLLTARPDMETVVVDSMTTLAYVALQNAVVINKSSIERPGMHGYTYRNASVLRATVALMKLCADHKRHLILITHEGSADRNDEGAIVSVTMALSEGTANQVGLRFNEVWWVNDNGKDRTIAIRPCRMRKPMKTRLFDATQPEFVWHYNPDTQEGEGIADWYGAWKDGGGRRLPLPARVTLKSIARR